MRSVMIIMASLAVGTAQAQVKGQATSRPTLTSPAKSEVQATTTNQVYRSLKYPHVAYSGVTVQAAKTRNPLQLINPFAPVRYGSAEANTTRDPVSGRSEGVKLFSVAFW